MIFFFFSSYMSRSSKHLTNASTTSLFCASFWFPRTLQTTVEKLLYEKKLGKLVETNQYLKRWFFLLTVLDSPNIWVIHQLLLYFVTSLVVQELDMLLVLHWKNFYFLSIIRKKETQIWKKLNRSSKYFSNTLIASLFCVRFCFSRASMATFWSLSFVQEF